MDFSSYSLFLFAGSFMHPAFMTFRFVPRWTARSSFDRLTFQAIAQANWFQVVT